MLRQGSCNNCGQCCGFSEDGNHTNPWPDHWPGSIVEWSEDACNQVPLFRLVTPPHISGQLSGIVEVNGREFSYYWHGGLRKSLEDHRCPFLVDNGDGRHLCGVYGTSHHEIWATTCNQFPKKEMTMLEAINTFKRYPNCSFYYVPEDNINDDIEE